MFFSDKRGERLFFFCLAGPEFIQRVEMDKKGESEQHELPEEFRGRAGANRQPADGQEALGARSTHAYRRSPNAERQTERC